MIQLKKFVFNLFSENTYLLWDDKTRECAVIDPGCFDESEKKVLENFIIHESLKVEYLINTHCHIDHIFGCEFIKKRFDPIYLVPELDFPLLQNANSQAAMFGIVFTFSLNPDQYLSEEKKINLGQSELNFLFTPGHSPGEYCIYLPNENICITGDVLFNASIGRTDLWGGNYDTLIKSIREKILVLPDNTTIYPGHGDSSTIDNEKRFNPFLN